MTAIPGFLLVVLAGFTGAGCMTALEGAHLHQETAAFRPRLDELDREEADRRRQTVELQEVLDRATALLTSASANVGAKEAKAESDVATLQARVDQIDGTLQRAAKERAEARNRLEIRLATLEHRAAQLLDRVAPLLPDDKETLWREASERARSGQTGQGRRFFRVFIRRTRRPKCRKRCGSSRKRSFSCISVRTGVLFSVIWSGASRSRRRQRMHKRRCKPSVDFQEPRAPAERIGKSFDDCPLMRAFY